MNVENFNLVVFGRRVGNTTRQVDAAIQDLFNTGTCILRDHYTEGYPSEQTTEATRRMAFIFKHRLEWEHKGVDVIYKNHMTNNEIKHIEVTLCSTDYGKNQK